MWYLPLELWFWGAMFFYGIVELSTYPLEECRETKRELFLRNESVILFRKQVFFQIFLWLF